MKTMALIDVTGTVVQTDGSTKTGPKYSYMEPNADFWLSALAGVIVRYEREQGECASFSIEIVK